MTIRATGSIEMGGDLVVKANKIVVATPSRPNWPRLARFTGDVEFGPEATTVASPMLVVRDGEEGSIFVGGTTKAGDFGYRATVTVRPSGGDDLDLTLAFTQQEGGATIREIGSTTLRVRDGDSCLVATTRPGGAR
jgi:hypothetical protein